MTLVVGATGALGLGICERLRASGVPVRALVRPNSPRETHLIQLGVDLVRGDLRNAPSLRVACRGARCVVSTATAMNPRRPGDGLKAVDLHGHISLVQAAKAAGVEHFVYTSIAPEANPRAALVRYKRRVERVVRESGMAWTIVQPAAFKEWYFSPAAGWDLESGRVHLVGPGTTPFNPVSGHDVAEFAAQSVVREDLRRRVIPVGGPDVVTPLEAVALFEEVSGRALQVRHVPASLAGVAVRLLHLFDPRRSSHLALRAHAGEVIDMSLVLAEIPVALTTLRQFAWRRLAR